MLVQDEPELKTRSDKTEVQMFEIDGNKQLRNAALLELTQYSDEIVKCPPLWYGILCEACAVNIDEKYSNTLGPVGSWIVAEHFKLKLEYQSDKYFIATHTEINSMRELLTFITKNQGENDDV